MDKILINAGTWGLQQAGELYYMRLALTENGWTHTYYAGIPPEVAQDILTMFQRLTEEHKNWEKVGK